jgi:general secretion pathway protein K
VIKRREDGFALLTVLWLILLLSVLMSSRIAPVVLARQAGVNRMLETRARWAALGCLELTRARFRGGDVEEKRDSLALGDMVWCTQDALRSDVRINPNVADSSGLQRFLHDEGAVASLLDWIDSDGIARPGGAESPWYRSRGRYLPRNGPIVDVAEMRLVRGFERFSLEELETYFTARGTGRVSANRAPDWALASVSTLSAEQVVDIIRHRRGSAYAAPDQLTAVTGMELTIPEFAELTTRLSFVDTERTVRIRGRVNGGSRVIESVLIVTLVPSDGELTVRRVEVR